MLSSLAGHSDRVLGVATDKEGHVASVGLDKSLRLWTPTLTSEKVKGQHQVEVTVITSAGDGGLVLSADRSVYFYL